ncbi:hypothetical protein RPC_1070 [Rhodopseudomonas palustris BisB18]|uniref:Uncharacterized protein n=1 Tax=Rhodopseudomonas palustris (strain BisB18) TaxID=316056 RepID=Q21AF2_RHOPB
MLFKSPGPSFRGTSSFFASEPGIHNHRRDYAFLTCSFFELAIRNDDNILVGRFNPNRKVSRSGGCIRRFSFVTVCRRFRQP